MSAMWRTHGFMSCGEYSNVNRRAILTRFGVRRLVQRESISAIARDLRLSRNTVKRAGTGALGALQMWSARVCKSSPHLKTFEIYSLAKCYASARSQICFSDPKF
jgi:hypothetical protein